MFLEHHMIYGRNTAQLGMTGMEQILANPISSSTTCNCVPRNCEVPGIPMQISPRTRYHTLPAPQKTPLMLPLNH